MYSDRIDQYVAVETAVHIPLMLNVFDPDKMFRYFIRVTFTADSEMEEFSVVQS